MDSTTTRQVRPNAGLLALGALLFAAASVAPAVAQPQPSYAIADETIEGTVSGFDGKYGLLVRDNGKSIDRSNCTTARSSIRPVSGWRSECA
jgi:hypothetical protein